MRIGLALSPCATQRASVAAFDPATLSLEGWWRADYSGSPWAGTASAGSSGSRNLTTLDVAPTTGTAQNGKTPAEYVAASSHSMGGAAASNFIANNAAFWWALVRFPSAAAGASHGALPAVWADSASNMWVTYGTIGGTHTLTFMKHDGTAQRKAQATGDLTGAYHLIHGRIVGGTISVGVDGTWTAGDAIANGGALTGTLVVGKNPNVAFINQRLAEIAFANSDLSSSLSSIKDSYVFSRYAVTL